MVTLPGIMAALAAPLISVGVGALDRRYLLIGLTLIMIIANTIVAYAVDFNLLLVGRVLLGVSIGGFWATAIALSGRLAPDGMGVAKANSIIMAGVTLATVVGVPVGTWLSGLMGWRMTFLVTAWWAYRCCWRRYSCCRGCCRKRLFASATCQPCSSTRKRGSG